MRLINARTLDFEEFYGSSTPPYAILSHTWGLGEVSLQQWAVRHSSAVAEKPGFAKIVGACRQALQDSISYVWVDTNCIDKTSSAELSEAINTMFAWYRDSVRCYVYLADVSMAPGSERTETLLVEFCSSKWFTRGWTLQELLAAPNVSFFDHDWKVLGNKNDPFLLPHISAVTGIYSEYVSGALSFESASVGERFSWFADRVTTRPEDTAYCMLGIFDINMPLLYGEGMKAFQRLQENIIAVSNDQTIFCWSYYDEESFPQKWNSILAPHPCAFRNSARYTKSTKKPFGTKGLSETYSITNAGLSIARPTLGAGPFGRIMIMGVECNGWDVVLILDKAGLRNQDFRHPLLMPWSSLLPWSKEYSHLDFQSKFLQCRGPGVFSHAEVPVSMLLIAQHHITMLAASRDDVHYTQAEDPKNTNLYMIVGRLSIPTGALQNVGDVVGAVFSTGFGARHFVVAVVRERRGYEWYIQKVHAHKARHSMDTAILRIQQHQDISTSFDRGMGWKCAIIPQPDFSATGVAIVFTRQELDGQKIEDKAVELGAYSNYGLVDVMDDELEQVEDRKGNRKRPGQTDGNGKEEVRSENAEGSHCCIVA